MYSQSNKDRTKTQGWSPWAWDDEQAQFFRTCRLANGSIRTQYANAPKRDALQGESSVDVRQGYYEYTSLQPSGSIRTPYSESPKRDALQGEPSLDGRQEYYNYTPLQPNESIRTPYSEIPKRDTPQGESSVGVRQGRYDYTPLQPSGSIITQYVEQPPKVTPTPSQPQYPRALQTIYSVDDTSPQTAASQYRFQHQWPPENQICAVENDSSLREAPRKFDKSRHINASESLPISPAVKATPNLYQRHSPYHFGQGTTVEEITPKFSSLEVEDDPAYVLIASPNRFFKLGRIFKTAEEDQAYVVVREEQGFSTVCALENNQDTAQDETDIKLSQFPIVAENPSVSVGSLASFNSNRLERISHGVKVQNIGRIDRKRIKELKATFSVPTSNINLESSSIQAKAHLSRSQGAIELYKEYIIHPSRDFSFGRVIKVLWSEPSGNSHDTSEMGSETIASKYGQKAYHSIRRFVIVRAREGHCLCLPISTYGGQGTVKYGVQAKHHAIIYTGKVPPSELPGEKPFRVRPIEVVPKTAGDKFSPASRINLSKIYTIEHNVKVSFIGKIHEDSEMDFRIEFRRNMLDDERILPDEGPDIYGAL